MPSPTGGSHWYAVYAETPRENAGRISPKDRDALAPNLVLAEALGATAVRVKRTRRPKGSSPSPAGKASRTSCSG